MMKKVQICRSLPFGVEYSIVVPSLKAIYSGKERVKRCAWFDTKKERYNFIQEQKEQRPDFKVICILNWDEMYSLEPKENCYMGPYERRYNFRTDYARGEAE